MKGTSQAASAKVNEIKKKYFILLSIIERQTIVSTRWDKPLVLAIALVFHTRSVDMKVGFMLNSWVLLVVWRDGFGGS